MSHSIKMDLKPDHVEGGFKWAKEPVCKCGLFAEAIKEKFIFVSNFTDDESNVFYMMPVNSDGYLVRESGVNVTHCPWCGESVKGKKLYGK